MSTALKKIPDGAGARDGSGVTPNTRPVEGAATGHVVPVAASKAAPAAKARPRSPASLRVTRIAAASPWYETGVSELARAWELLLVFTWRQIGVQYKQAVLGIGWAVLAPLMSTIVFTFVFGKLGGMPSDGLPYPVFVLSGLVTWQFFARALAVGSNSIVGNAGIITKVYFPRMVLPLSSVLSGLADYGVNLVVLLAVMAFYGLRPGPELALLPVFVLLATLIGFAFSLWLSSLNALYRDIGFMIPIVLQAWMFMTPVIYPANLVPADFVWLMQINPMTVVVEGARWAMLPSATPPDPADFLILIAEMAVLFFGGVVTFNKIDAILADRI